MGQGRARFNLAWLVLCVLAVQGITPDAQDLASFNVISILFPWTDNGESTTADHDPSDEVCDYDNTQIHRAARSVVTQKRLEPAYVEFDTRPLSVSLPAASRRMVVDGIQVRFARLIHQLCRLNC
jgi:hypothetical protein